MIISTLSSLNNKTISDYFGIIFETSTYINTLKDDLKSMLKTVSGKDNTLIDEIIHQVKDETLNKVMEKVKYNYPDSNAILNIKIDVRINSDGSISCNIYGDVVKLIDN
jgi:uncharacterized protein YbjQ (UPF0145 family)